MRLKRGDLESNMISLLIALLALSVLFFGAYKLYTNIKNNEIEQAKNFLDELEGKIELTEDRSEFNIRGVGKDAKNPTWFLVGFGKSDSLDSKPERCSFDSCICVCNLPANDVSHQTSKSEFVEACKNPKDSICRKIEFDDVYVNMIGALEYNIWNEKSSGYTENYFIPLASKLYQLKLRKSVDDKILYITFLHDSIQKQQDEREKIKNE